MNYCPCKHHFKKVFPIDNVLEVVFKVSLFQCFKPDLQSTPRVSWKNLLFFRRLRERLKIVCIEFDRDWLEVEVTNVECLFYKRAKVNLSDINHDWTDLDVCELCWYELFVDNSFLLLVLCLRRICLDLLIDIEWWDISHFYLFSVTISNNFAFFMFSEINRVSIKGLIDRSYIGRFKVCRRFVCIFQVWTIIFIVCFCFIYMTYLVFQKGIIQVFYLNFLAFYLTISLIQ